MPSADLEVLRRAAAWIEAGHPVLLATVVHTWGSAPRPPGSLMILRDDGVVAGSVSGGCVEDDLIRRLHASDFNVSRPLVLTYGATAEEARRFGLPCGGPLQIVLELLTAHSGLSALLEAAEGPTHRRTQLGHGDRSGHAAGGNDRGLPAF